ncbi:MAG: TlpA family protein disulfide reductase, partial [Proteobacteria bacterium]|nr:TlpA family protein disulfide reductase [Pseudomonadota bacterium]
YGGRYGNGGGPLNSLMKRYENGGPHGDDEKKEDASSAFFGLYPQETQQEPKRETVSAQRGTNMLPEVEIVGKNNIQVIGVNVEGVTYDKAKAFLDDLKVTNFDTFFDKDLQLVKQLSLRGVPTTLLINKEGKEFARVVGSINFEDSKFIDWIKQF